MQQNFKSVAAVAPGILATNRVIRNTYLLLSMTILFSAFTAFVSTSLQIALPFWAIILGYFGLLYMTNATANSAMGLVSVFLFTGFMGLTLGPTLNYYIHGFSNGPELVTAALASTGALFFALSGYAMTTRKDFSYMGGFLFIGLTIAILVSIAGLFLNMPGLQLAVSGAIVLLMSGYLLYQTSLIINGGERNYIMATVSLYITLLNLFTSLLQLLAAFSGRRD